MFKATSWGLSPAADTGPPAPEMLAVGKGLCPWLWEHQTLTPQPYSLSLLGKKQYV